MRSVSRRTTGGARRRRAIAGAALSLAALGLTGCGAAATSTSAGSDVAAVVDGVVAPQPAYAGEDTAARTTTGGSATTGAQPAVVAADRSVVVIADTSVRVSDVPAATAALGTVAVRYAASVENQVSSRGDGPPVPQPAYDDKQCVEQGICPAPPTGYASSTTTLRVDNADVDALLRDVAGLGTVEASTRSSADVTGEVADVDARVRNAEASLARVRALMGKATSIGDIVALEGELSRRQADLEALQARQRTLADQTAQATVTVRLYSADAPAPEEEQTGFLAGLSAGWDAFTGALVVALTVLGALVPFLLVLAPLALIVWVVVQRSRRTPPAPSPSPAEG
jgi:hypothetical protein